MNPFIIYRYLHRNFENFFLKIYFISMSGYLPPHAPPSLWLLGVPPPISLKSSGGKSINFQNIYVMNTNEMFTNSLTGAAFCEQNGSVVIKKNDSGKVFFSSTGSHPLHRSGYISDAAAAIISKEMKAGSKLKNVISTFLDFAVINYVDDEGAPQECPTLMPKASGETLYGADDWE